MNAFDEICKSFNAHAHEYEQAAKVQKEIGERLFARLAYLKIKPRRILDLGCGTGWFTQKLKKTYPKAEIVAIDLAYEMLVNAKAKQGFLRKWSLLGADMQSLPFASKSFDMVFANQVIHWADPAKVFREVGRVMNTDGCFMFTTLGPDTFKELKQAWALADRYDHVNRFADMHDIGDWLLQEKFVDPVVDMEVLTLRYKSLLSLLQALKAQGVRNIHEQRNKGLTGLRAWRQFEKFYTEKLSTDNKFPLSYEVIYGHAWKGAVRKNSSSLESFFPVSEIKVLRSS